MLINAGDYLRLLWLDGQNSIASVFHGVKGVLRMENLRFVGDLLVGEKVVRSFTSHQGYLRLLVLVSLLWIVLKRVRSRPKLAHRLTPLTTPRVPAKDREASPDAKKPVQTGNQPSTENSVETADPSTSAVLSRQQSFEKLYRSFLDSVAAETHGVGVPPPNPSQPQSRADSETQPSTKVEEPSQNP
jgi:hypothetical protein